ncbi:MAG: hypothetical protein AAGA56_25470 [Myxococcota bacterium]
MGRYELSSVLGLCGCGIRGSEEDGTTSTLAATTTPATTGTTDNSDGGEVTGCCFFSCDGGSDAGNFAGPGLNDQAACDSYAAAECGSSGVEMNEYVDGCTGCNTSCAPDGYPSIPD